MDRETRYPKSYSRRSTWAHDRFHEAWPRGETTKTFYVEHVEERALVKCHECDAPATRKCVGDNGWTAYCPKHPTQLPVKFDLDIDEQ